MKIGIFGATGALGVQLTNLALGSGHKVTVLTRDPSRPSIRHENLIVVRGDVLDRTTIDPVVLGQDVVLSTLGAGRSTKPTVVFSQGTQNIIESAENHGVSRFVCVSSAGVEDDPSFPFFYRKIIRPLLLKNVYLDMAEMEKRVRQSNLDWTIIQPYTLTDGPLTRNYRTAVNTLIPRAKNISRADVAHLMLEMAFQEGERDAIAIAY